MPTNNDVTTLELLWYDVLPEWPLPDDHKNFFRNQLRNHTLTTVIATIEGIARNKNSVRKHPAGLIAANLRQKREKVNPNLQPITNSLYFDERGSRV